MYGKGSKARACSTISVGRDVHGEEPESSSIELVNSGIILTTETSP